MTVPPGGQTRSSKESGRLGGLQTWQNHGESHMRAIGMKGGMVTRASNGPAHFRRLGLLSAAKRALKRGKAERAAALYEEASKL